MTKLTPYQAKCLLDKGYNYILCRVIDEKVLMDKIVSKHKDFDTAWKREEKYPDKFTVVRTIEYLFPNERLG